jgi:hypothetical protein
LILCFANAHRPIVAARFKRRVAGNIAAIAAKAAGVMAMRIMRGILSPTPDTRAPGFFAPDPAGALPMKKVGLNRRLFFTLSIADAYRA